VGTSAKFSRYLLPLAVFMVLLVPSITNASKKVTTVEGIIQYVSYDSIEVRGRYYDISGVPLVDASGKTLTKAYLRQGVKVEIFFENGKMTSILIYRYKAE
jgi:hypothetical protein